jgi:hypothetical protein
MPRPAPLAIFHNGHQTRTEYQSLTPRTPHSRHGHTDTSRTSIELESTNADDVTEEIDHAGSQRVPLLGVHSDVELRDNPYFNWESSRSSHHRAVRLVLTSFPLWGGILLAGFLLFLVFISLKRPHTLPNATGAKNETEAAQYEPTLAQSNVSAGTDTHDEDENFISYENYTQFPLLPTEYRNECAKMYTGYMHGHGTYWAPMAGMPTDVPHPEPEDTGVHYPVAEDETIAVCSSTITYMLDGHVGLMADLALMAQVAALARERNRTFLVDDTYWNRGK